MPNLIFNLTSSEPNVAQTEIAKSTGGYPSTTAINPSYVLSNDLSAYETNLNMGITPYAFLAGSELMTVQGENITRNVLASNPQFHASGSEIYAVSKNNLFNSSFNTYNKQYRCLAVTNNTDSTTFYNLRFYFKLMPNSTSTLKIALELPQTDVVRNYATRGTTISLVDTSKIDTLESHYEGNVMTITSGNNINLSRKIITFDSLTGTFTFLNSFPYTILAGTSYRVENSPSQMVASGALSPTFGTTYVSNLTTPNGVDNSVEIDFNDNRTNGSDFHPRETVYLWFERTITPGIGNSNRLIFTVSYENS